MTKEEIEIEKLMTKHKLPTSFKVLYGLEITRIAVEYANQCNKVRDKSEQSCNKVRDEYMEEDILDIINSENSGLSHQQRLNEIENLLNK